jgi:hypothetical protein
MQEELVYTLQDGQRIKINVEKVKYLLLLKDHRMKN